MSQDSKHPAGALSANRRGLLHELDDIRSLLGDSAGDADALDIPLLEPEGDAHTQIPLLGGDLLAQPPVNTPAPASAAPVIVEQAIAERENPFLPRATIERLAQHHRQTPPALQPAAEPAPAPPLTDAPPLDDRAMRSLVDDVLAQWMPRIEDELRARLLQELRGDDD